MINTGKRNLHKVFMVNEEEAQILEILTDYYHEPYAVYIRRRALEDYRNLVKEGKINDELGY